MKGRGKSLFGIAPVRRDLLEACKAMLPLVCLHCAGTPEGDRVIKMAEQAIARAEKNDPKALQKSLAYEKSHYFGKIGKHYDMEVTISRTHEWAQGYHYEGQDRLGRKVLIRVTDEEDTNLVEAGETVFLRGHVLAHDMVFGAPFTFVETSSGVTRISDVPIGLSG